MNSVGPPGGGHRAHERPGRDGAGPATAPDREKRVGWTELFFDLIFVFAITQVSASIQADHTGIGLLRALVVFVPLYWMWVGAAIRTNQRDAEALPERLVLFAVALASIFMAVAVPQAYRELALLFALAYWVGRILLGAGLLRRSARGPGPAATPYAVSIAITGPLLVAGAVTGGGSQLVLWAAAAVIDLSTPTILRSRLRGMRFDAGHLTERFGLFVLIALGESVVAAGSSAGDHLGVANGAAIAAAFAVTCGLWWVYFHFAHAAVHHALSTATVQLDITRLVLSYGHLMFIAAITTFSTGLHRAVAHPGEGLGWDGAALLYGGCALFLATFGFTRWVMFRLISRTRLAAALTVLALLPLAVVVPALAALAVLVTIVAALNVLELRINDREGWRAHASRAPNRS